MNHSSSKCDTDHSGSSGKIRRLKFVSLLAIAAMVFVFLRRPEPPQDIAAQRKASPEAVEPAELLPENSAVPTERSAGGGSTDAAATSVADVHKLSGDLSDTRMPAEPVLSKPDTASLQSDERMVKSEPAASSGQGTDAGTSNSAPVEPAPIPEPDDGASKPLPPLNPLLADELKDATPLNPDSTVYLDRSENRVILRTEVACPNCILEMLLVPERNREHETILRIRSSAWVIHTALLALGLEPGKPVQYSPEFVAPSGPVINIEAVYVGNDGTVQRHPAQEWIRRNIHRYHAAPLAGLPAGLELPYRNLRWDKFNNEVLWYGPMTEEERDDLLSKSDDGDYQNAIQTFYREGKSVAMTAQFVFAGSSFYTDEETGESFYQAEGGHLICTSNFPDALLDVQEQSSADTGSLSYEGWAERIPAEGTPVLLILTPGDTETAADASAASPASSKPSGDKQSGEQSSGKETSAAEPNDADLSDSLRGESL